MNIKKYSWLAALPMIFTACQNDALVENQSHDGLIYTLSAQMDGGAAMSRAQIQLNNPNSGEEIFFWNQEDHFNLYQYRDNAWQQHHFTISSDYDGSSTSAEFTTLNAAVESIDFQAFYPSSLYLDNNRIEKSLATYLDFSSSTPEVVWKNYFNNNMFMVAQGNFSEMDSPTVSFNHLCALARVSYTNKSGADKQINGIRLWSYGEQEFGTTYVYNASEGQGNISIKTSWYEVYTNGLTVPAGETTDLYLLFYPTEFADCDMYITIMEPDKEPNVVMPVSDIAAANPNATGFEAGKRYWFKVTETPDQLVWTKNYTDEPENNNVVFTNKELSLALYDYLEVQGKMPGAVTFDADSCAVMTPEDVAEVETLEFRQTPLTSLAGIENFKNLTSLTCYRNGLTSCDLSQNTALKYLNLTYQYNLTDFVLTNHDAIRSVFLDFSSGLESVNLDGNSNLETISAFWCENLSSLTFTGCTSVTMLDYGYTALQSITIPEPSKIDWLRYSGAFQPLDLINFTGLHALHCDEIEPGAVDAIPTAIKGQLYELRCNANQLTALDLSEFPNLRYLGCRDNALTALDLSSCPDLMEVDCDGNKLTSLDASGLASLEILFANKNQLSSLTVTGCIALMDIECHTNKMSTLDLSDCASLRNVLCGQQDNANNGIMYVKLADEIKHMWADRWGTDFYNEGVEVVDTLP